MKNNKTVLYLCIIVFGLLGVYLTFITGNTDSYDRQIKAYRIDPNESYDSDNGTTYKPIYYFKIGDREYECKAKMGSSSYPSESNNTVYYDSEDPAKCKTEYDKKASKLPGIILLVVTGVLIYFAIRPASSSVATYPNENYNPDDFASEGETLDEEKTQKINEYLDRIHIIVNRIILGIIILILLAIVLFNTIFFRNTIISKNYPEAEATYVETLSHEENDLFIDCIYTFQDTQGREQRITYSILNGNEPTAVIKIKYNENNPEDYYTEGNLMDKSASTWYIVKVVILLLLIALFFNKKLLSKVRLSTGSGRR